MMLFNAIGASEEINEFHKILRTGITPPKLNILISFPYIRGQISNLIKLKSDNKIGKLFLDAGTYTLNKKHTTLDPLPENRFAEYVHYVKMYGKYFDHIAAYDEDFFDPDLNFHHLLRMHKIIGDELSKKLIPVVHESNDEAVRELRDIIKMGYDYIAIGSQPVNKMPVWKKIEAVVREEKARGKDIKTHLFGIMSRPKLMEKKPYSADASSFAKVGGQDAILYWNHETNDLDTVKLLDLTNIEQAAKDKRVKWENKHDQYLSRLFKDCTKDTLIVKTTQRHVVSFYAIYEMEKYFTDLANQPVQS
jgi:hypothetical protein